MEELEHGNRTAIMLYDISKAFDCVSHDILLEKLNYYGVRGIPLKLIGSYLSNRKQCVTVNGVTSDFLEVSHGVSQGSVLGPLLFIIYINDLSRFMLPYMSILFADDSTFIISEKDNTNLAASLDCVSNRANEWFSSNKLKLNNNKTEIMHISASNQLSFHQKTTNVKLLGLVLDHRLSWQAHIEHLVKKLPSSLFLLRHLKNITNSSTLKTTYFSLFHSHISYGIALWGNSSHALTVFKMQKKAIRVLVSRLH